MDEPLEGKFVVGNLSVEDRIVGFWGEDHVDGRHLPTLFDSKEEAVAEIRELVSDTEEAYKIGDIASPSTIDDFKVLDSSDPIIAAMLCEEFPDIGTGEPSTPSDKGPAP